MIILGAGLSGLLFGALHPGSTIYESKKDGADEHKAVLRMRTNEISKFTGIPFEKVLVNKSIWYEGKDAAPSPRMTHLYSRKVIGKISTRSIVNIDPVVRYVPPIDFLAQLKAKCNINYQCRISEIDEGSCAYHKQATFARTGRLDTPIISTLPISALSEITNLCINAACLSEKIYVSHFKIPDCDAHATIYYPKLSASIYRATLSGPKLIVESTQKITNSEIIDVFRSLGLPEQSMMYNAQLDMPQNIGKIYPIPNKIRSQFILGATLKYNVYSLGRFATWRPEVLLDDVLNDIFVIRRLIGEGNYSAMNHKQGE